MQHGVYCIENVYNGKFYIGSAAVSFRQRFSTHLSKLKKGKHENARLQNAFNKYGGQVFRFSIVEYVKPENCIEREQFFIDMFKPQYNILPTAGSRRGAKHPQEVRKKISEAGKKRWASPTERQKMLEIMEKVHSSPETRRKISKALKGKKHTEEHKRKTSEANKKRWSSIEKRREMSDAKKKFYTSSEERQKQSERMQKRYESPEERQKLSEALKKACASQEVRQKKSDIAREIWVKRKALNKLRV